MKNCWMFVITGMLLIVTTTGFGRMAYGVILPFMQEGMNFTTTQSGYLGTMLFLGYLLNSGNFRNTYNTHWCKKCSVSRGSLCHFRVNGTGVRHKFLVGCHHTVPCRCWECTCLYATTIDSH